MHRWELRSHRGSRLVKIVLWIFMNFTDIHETGESFFSIFILTFFTYSGRNFGSRREDAPNTDISPVPVSEFVDDRSGRPDETQANKNLKPSKKETPIERGDPLCSDNSEIPEWLQEFRENLVDDEIPLQGGSHASSSHEASLEPIVKRREDLGKHNVHTHFPKDRNCEICKRTKITRAPCRRRKGEAVPRVDNFGDLITADHKVLSDNCESRNNHRYAVVVQDLATQWIQAYPCKNKTSQETQRSLQKFLEPERKPKVIYTDNSLEFGKACEDLSWNHCTFTPHRSGTDGIAERAVRRVKEGTSVFGMAIRSEWKLVGRFYGILHLSAKLHRFIIWWEDDLWKTFWATISRTYYSFWFIGCVSPNNCEGSVKNPSILKASLTWIVLRIRSVRGRNLEGWRTDCRRWGVGDDGRIGNLLEKIQCERGDISQRRRIYFSDRRWTNQTLWRRSGTENIHLDTASTSSRRKSRWFCWRIRRVSSTTSRFASGCWRSEKWLLVFDRKFHNPESNFTRREKNHSHFHWSTWMFPITRI